MGLGSFLKKTVGTIGGGIVGGLLGGPVGAIAGASIGNAYDSSKATDKQNALAQSQYDQNVALQKEFAQNSMQWRVDDAKKAGLHPMAALGIQGSSFTPIQTIGYAQDNSASNLMNAISNMGQSVNYASTKAKDNQQQQVAVRLAQEGVELQNEGLRLDNEFKRWQLLQAMETGTSQALRSPAAPPTKENNLIPGQGDSLVNIEPDKVVASSDVAGSVTAGTHPLWSHARTGDFILPVLSPDLADAVTENKEKHIGAEISYALSAWKGSVRPPMNAFTNTEKTRIASGEYTAYYYPFLGWRVEPTMSWKNFKRFVLGEFQTGYSKDGRVYSGRLR